MAVPRRLVRSLIGAGVAALVGVAAPSLARADGPAPPLDGPPLADAVARPGPVDEPSVVLAHWHDGYPWGWGYYHRPYYRGYAYRYAPPVVVVPRRLYVPPAPVYPWPYYRPVYPRPVYPPAPYYVP